METVQIQCGGCQRVMAVSVEHLGSQVHCPHCQAIVETPAAPWPHAPERQDHGDAESIFAAPEVSDAIFDGGPSRPLIEMPVEKKDPIPFTETAKETATGPSGAPPHPSSENDSGAPFHLDQTAEDYTPVSGRVPDSAWSEETPFRETTVAARPRRLVKNSAMVPILLIVLIPYALLATGVIAYLCILLNQNRLADPLERLPDPKPKAKDGGPRFQERVQHDSPLPATLKARLGEALRVGALEVTPVKVHWTGEALVLHLHMKNVSSDQTFNPISHEFFKDDGAAKNGNRPYSYLEGSRYKVYGGFPEWLKYPDGKDGSIRGDIGPGEQELIRIATMPEYTGAVKRLLESRDALVWRVQVRRGFVDVRGSPVSATAVVGVEFSAKDIDKDS